MPLKQINVAAPKTSSKKSDIPMIAMEGKVVSRHNFLVGEIKKLESELENDVKPVLHQKGVRELFEINHTAPGLISSVKLEDETGAIACLSFQNKYSSADAEAADAVFTELGEDINDHMVQTTKAAFDSKFFLDADGNFDQAAYDEVQKALEAVAKKLKKSNPLTCKTVVVPKPEFHEARFKKFTPEANMRLSEVLPNTITLKESK